MAVFGLKNAVAVTNHALRKDGGDLATPLFRRQIGRGERLARHAFVTPEGATLDGLASSLGYVCR
jgi:hypothetical protein